MSDTEIAIQPINISSKVKATERYKKFLQVASLFLKEPITPVEVSIIDELYHAESGLVTTESRKTVRDNLNTSAEQLNNYIRSLRKKKLIKDDSIHPLFLQILPEGDFMVISIKLEVIL